MPLNDDDSVSNPSSNRHFNEVLEVNLKRRQVLMGGLALATAGFFGVPGLGALRQAQAAPIPSRPGFGGIGFEGIDPNTLDNGLVDDVLLPPGYSYRVLYAWGDPTGVLGQIPGQPAYKDDASNTAIEQALQSGAHHDGMYYFPRSGRSGNQRGILCINHEYDDQDLSVPGRHGHLGSREGAQVPARPRRQRHRGVGEPAHPPVGGEAPLALRPPHPRQHPDAAHRPRGRG